MAFLTRTAILDQLSGPLCDAVLQVSGSDRVLASLAGRTRSSRWTRHDRWYRYHQLLQELLLDELERREPDLVPELHRRAAGWFEGDGLPELAVDHRQAAGDSDQVARLVAGLAFPAYAGGRVETARRWLRWFEDRDLVARYPRVTVLGAQMEALLGSASKAERWAATAELGLAAAPDAPWTPRRRCCVPSCAMTAWPGCGPTPPPPGPGWPRTIPWRATALLVEGIAHLLDGQAELADPILRRAAELAGQAGRRRRPRPPWPSRP